MPNEIERKFLVRGNCWREKARGQECFQGYLCLSVNSLVRVRVIGKEAFLTFKTRNRSLTRSEFEYRIPRKDGEELLKFCKGTIHKRRYRVRAAGHLWDVDEYLGENRGLFVAEIELEHPRQKIILPPWVGKEISHNHRYFNVNLLRRPFRKWRNR